ncbi:hypothetical protein SAMN02787100_1849 [Chryseobacterium sp. OV279]|nr:hypothetical protein SAMN02787100_1849 [Chryseobacterium sp. OV279]
MYAIKKSQTIDNKDELIKVAERYIEPFEIIEKNDLIEYRNLEMKLRSNFLTSLVIFFLCFYYYS